METTHAQRRRAVLKKFQADFTKIKDARNKAYQVAYAKGIPKAEVDKRFGEETTRRFHTTESKDPVVIYGEIAQSLTAVTTQRESSLS